MFQKNHNHRTKFKATVTISMADGELFDAVIFVRPDERLQDLLNDDRQFIPASRRDGKTIMLAKSNIVSVVERSVEDPPPGYDEDDDGNETIYIMDDSSNEHYANEEAARRYKEQQTSQPKKKRFDPYETLRVSRDATLPEIRRAYKARIKAVHPDTLSGLELDDDLSKAAILATQKVNRAYQRILKERQEAEAAEEAEEAKKAAKRAAREGASQRDTANNKADNKEDA